MTETIKVKTLEGKVDYLERLLKEINANCKYKKRVEEANKTIDAYCREHLTGGNVGVFIADLKEILSGKPMELSKE